MLVLFPIAIYIILVAPYLFIIPGGDGNVEFLLANNISNGSYFTNFSSFHPPLKIFILSFFFSLFGYWSFGLVGLLLGYIGIYAQYHIAQHLFDKKVALLSATLLALSGLFISVGIFSIGDFVMTVMILVAFAFYIQKKYYLYGLFASLAVLSKETAIFFALSVLIIEVFHRKKHIIPLILPFIALFAWLGLLYLSGNQLWNDYNFSSTAEKGSMYTIMYNLLTFNFLNIYAYENWLHLFVFNFNWVFWIFAFLSIRYINYKKI